MLITSLSSVSDRSRKNMDTNTTSLQCLYGTVDLCFFFMFRGKKMWLVYVFFFSARLKTLWWWMIGGASISHVTMVMFTPVVTDTAQVGALWIVYSLISDQCRYYYRCCYYMPCWIALVIRVLCLVWLVGGVSSQFRCFSFFMPFGQTAEIFPFFLWIFQSLLGSPTSVFSC